MKKILCISLAIALSVVPAVLCAQDGDSPARKKVAVVLSGGGAKGVAHIGALRVIEQAGIPVDIIVGTSMGSIIGGLYSIGYTPDQLDSMVMTQDWNLLLSDRPRRRSQSLSQKEADSKYIVSIPFGRKFEDIRSGGLIRGSNLDMLFNDLMVGYHDTVDFNTLPIPFACVASNVVDGREVVFRKGVLPLAMRASMAIPGAFAPVYTEDAVLVDGGMLNNFPTDVAMQMGADFIIGVDVQTELRSRDELVGTPSILGQIVDLAMQQRTYHRNVNLADVYMKVDVTGYSLASFNTPALDTLIRRGKEAAIAQWDDLMELKRDIGTSEYFRPEKRGPYTALSERGKFHVYNVHFEELGNRQKKWLMRKCNMTPDSEIDIATLEHCMSMLNATQSYSSIYYTLTDTLDGYNLRFQMARERGNFINVGLNFDTEEIASVLLNTTMRLSRKNPSQFSATARFGKRITGQLDLLLFTGQLNNFNFTYAFQHNDIFANDKGRRAYNPLFNYHLLNVGYNEMDFIRQNLRLSAGLKYEHYIFRNDPVGFEHESGLLPLENDGYVSYYANLLHESFNNRAFPHRGSLVTLGYSLYTDNFVNFRGNDPFSALAFSWSTAIPVSQRFSLMPGLYGRVVWGPEIPFPFLNMTGGQTFGRYLPQQLPFDGVGYMEAMPHAFIAARLKGQYRIGQRHYAMGSLNCGITDNHFFQLFEGRQLWGASIDYGYASPIGPLRVSFNWSNITRSLGFYAQLGYNF